MKKSLSRYLPALALTLALLMPAAAEQRAEGDDAATIGNHEFDNGQDELARRTGNAEFPLLCANYTFNKSKLNSLLKPYVIIERAGRKFGIIGLTVKRKKLVTNSVQDVMEYQNRR